LQRRLDSLRREQENVQEAVAAGGLRAKLAEQTVEMAALAYRRDQERKVLAEIIERSIARRGASST
jgi:hypothetical protein